jgi:negative regulator of sigma E activity
MQDKDNQIDAQKLSQLMDGEWHELNPSDCVVNICGNDQLRAKWERYHLIRDALNNEPVCVDKSLALRISDAIDREPAYSNITPFSGPLGTQQKSVPVEQAVETETQSPTEQATPSPERESTGHIEAAERRGVSLFNTGLTGFALAASVALVTVVGLNLFYDSAETNVGAVAENVSTQGADSVTVNTEAVAVATPRPVEGSSAFSTQGSDAILPEVEFVSNSGGFWVSNESEQRVGDEQRLNMMLSRHLDNSPTSSREGLLPYSRLVGYEESAQDR